MTLKTLIGLMELFSEDMECPTPELAAEARKAHNSLSRGVDQLLPVEKAQDINCDLLDLVGLYELKGFALDLAVAKRLAKEWP